MYRFLLKRLAPFYALILSVEFLTFGILLIAEQEYINWSFMPMIKTIGVLFKTTTISFLYMMLPYMVYLGLLPDKFVNTKADKNISTSAYSIFVFLVLFEETMSLVYWGKFSTAFDMLAVEYLFDIREVAGDIAQNYLFAAYIVALMFITRIIVLKTQSYLFCEPPFPKLAKRIFYLLIYICCCGLIYVNGNDDDLQINENQINNELSKDGTYSLVRSIWKAEFKRK